MKMSKMKIYLEDENARDEIHWYCDDNIWNLLASYRKLVVKLGFTWSRRHKTTDFRVIIHSEKKVVTATIAYCRLVFTSHKLEINVPWLAAESVCVVCAVVMCGAKIFFVWIIVERRMKLISQILVLFTIPVYLVIQVNIRMKTISKIRPFF